MALNFELPKWLNFLTSKVFYFSLLGILLIIIGQTGFVSYVFPNFLNKENVVNPIIKTVGATFVGSGVFTAVIKSSEYTQIFSKVIGEIIWSKKYIEKRGDKKEIWSMVSRLIYDEKFPDISHELEEIITNNYFPVEHDYYTENYEFTINISDHTSSNDYWDQIETTSLTIKSINSKKVIIYKLNGSIDLPDSNGTSQDLTDYKIEELKIDNVVRTCDVPFTKDDKFLIHSFEIPLCHEDSYNVMIKRKKTVFKKTNPDKRFFASNIIKGLKITVIMHKDTVVNLHKMGTIGEYISLGDQINKDVKISTWKYDGIILPHQGFMLLFK